MVTSSRSSADAPERDATGVASASVSVLRMGLSGRLFMAAGAIVILWSAIAVGLS